MSADLTKRVQNYVSFADLREAMMNADRYDFDIVQVKFDGWWARVVVSRTQHPMEARIYSRQGQLKEIVPLDRQYPDCVIVGEFLRGTNRSSGGASSSDADKDAVMAFDIMSHDHAHGDILHWTYRDRQNFIALAIEQGALPPMVRAVPSYPLHKSRAVWQEFVIDGNAEGLVFRSNSDHYLSSNIGRVKREFTMDYVVMGWYPGKGKRSNMAGGLVCGLIDHSLSVAEAYEAREKFLKKNKDVKGFLPGEVLHGLLVPVVKVGGGFNDQEMTDQYANFASYRYRVLEVKGWQYFADTGAMRHPNAVRDAQGNIRWRSDKRIEDCVKPQAD